MGFARLALAHARANLVAYAALFVALGGTAYAAATVGSKQIENNSVKSADLKNNGVRGKDIRESSLDEVPAARDADTLGGNGPGAFARRGETAVEEGQVTSGAFVYQDLGGPEVTVDVGASGLVAVYAEAEIDAIPHPDPGVLQRGTVGLFEDNAQVPDLNDCNGGGAALFSATEDDPDFARVATGATDPNRCSGRRRYGHPIVVRTTPGAHTFELRYVDNIGNAAIFPVHFRDRLLWVAPLD